MHLFILQIEFEQFTNDCSLISTTKWLCINIHSKFLTGFHDTYVRDMFIEC